jgi:hypothetical protein
MKIRSRCHQATSEFGTFEASRDVRPSVAIRGKADVARTSHFGSDPSRTLDLAAFQPNWTVSRSPLRRKVLEFKCILEDRMTPRELFAFVGASAQSE